MVPATRQAARRRLPIGAEVQGGGVHFRVWLARAKVQVAFEGRNAPAPQSLTAESSGYFSVFVDGVGVGTRYGFRLDDDPQPYPDPASRCQPDGPHGLSEIVDPARSLARLAVARPSSSRARCSTSCTSARSRPRGRCRGRRAISRLAELGVTLIEVMPVAEFTGEFGWGYDGVDLFAPTRLYGTPDDFRRFVDRPTGSAWA